jgi:hypothetical protein
VINLKSDDMYTQRRSLRTAFFLACLAILALLPTSAAAQDGDYDGLPDSLELSLARYYFPVLNLHCGSYEGTAYGDKRQLYGLTVSGYTNSSNGRIPFTARPFTPNDGWNCTEDRQCIEIRYGIAWNWDLGDDSFGGSHRGDSEMYAIIVARKDTDGADWGVSWEAAQNDPGQWRLIREFMSAHWGTSSDSSSFRSHGNYGTTSYQRIWAAEGKHALYQTQNACNGGGFAGADDCGDNRCDIVSEVFTKVQNIGEWYAPLNRYIPYPGATKTTSPSGYYDMWSYQPFANSTAYRENMENWLDWCPNTWCF